MSLVHSPPHHPYVKTTAATTAATLLMLLGWGWPMGVLPAAAQEASRVETLRVEGEQWTVTQDGEGWSLTGAVRIVPRLHQRAGQAPPPWQLSAAAARLEGAWLTVEEVELVWGERRLRARTLTVHLDTGQAKGTGVELVAPIEGSDRVVRLRGDQLTVERDQVSIDAVVLEPCGCREDEEDQGALVLTAAQARVVLQGPLLELRTVKPAEALRREARVEAEAVALKAGPVPLVWLPRLTYPFDGRRSGLLPPTVGLLGDDQGLHVGAGAFWAPAPSWDVTSRVWWRTGGVGGAELRWRYAALDRLSEPRRSTLEVTGVVDTLAEETETGVTVRGRGALASRGQPDLRYDARYTSRPTMIDQLRLPLAERLGSPTRSAVLLGDVGSWSAFEVQGVLAQQRVTDTVPNANPEVTLPRFWIAPEAAFSLRLQPIEPLLLDLNLSFGRIAPDGRGSIPDASDPVQRLGLQLIAELPLLRGRLGTVRTFGGVVQNLDSWTATTPDDEANTAGQPILRQRTVAWGGLQLSTRLQGNPGGLRHTLRPAIQVSGAAFREVNAFDDESADETLPYATAPYDPALPLWTIQGVLQQRFGHAHRTHVTLDLGVIDLHNLQSAWSPLDNGTSMVAEGLAVADRQMRGGAELRLRASDGWELRSDVIVELEGLDTGLHEAVGAAGISWGSSGRIEVGLGHFTSGPRLTHTPWRLDDRELPGLHPFGRASDLTGATTNLVLPVPGLDTLQLRANALVPLIGDDIAQEDAEVSAALALGQLAGCIDLELRASRYTTPRVTDLFLNARVGPLP